MMPMMEKILGYKMQQDKDGIAKPVYRLKDQEVVGLFKELATSHFYNSSKVLSAVTYIELFLTTSDRSFLEYALKEYDMLYGVKLRLDRPVYKFTNVYRYC